MVHPHMVYQTREERVYQRDVDVYPEGDAGVVGDTAGSHNDFTYIEPDMMPGKVKP